MFTIDLLKGQGIPIKSRPEGVAIGVIAISVPLTVAILLFSLYLRNTIIISIQRQGIENYQAQIDKLAGAVKQYKSLEAEKQLYKSYLSEVKSSIVRHTQWSPILATLVETMPRPVVLTKLEVKQRHARRKVPKKDDPDATIDISVPVRSLHINVAANIESDSYEVVRDYRNSLLNAKPLEAKLENISVAQETGKLGGTEVISYEINCAFRPAF
jgi:Tfp pilus assembly protein PilN